MTIEDEFIHIDDSLRDVTKEVSRRIEPRVRTEGELTTAEATGTKL